MHCMKSQLPIEIHGIRSCLQRHIPFPRLFFQIFAHSSHQTPSNTSVMIFFVHEKKRQMVVVPHRSRSDDPDTIQSHHHLISPLPERLIEVFIRNKFMKITDSLLCIIHRLIFQKRSRSHSSYLPYCTVSPIQDQGRLCSQAIPGISLQIHCQMSSIATSASSSFRSSCLSFSYSFTVMFFTPALFRESHAL